LQTRKWQDQSGAEKFTTEIVLQRFRGELTLLDGRSGGGSGDSDEYQGGGSSDFGRSSPLEAPRGGGNSRQPAASSSYAADLDDDIPF
jgi:single-strand DNA-binding protein